jgi:hypothetical protein
VPALPSVFIAQEVGNALNLSGLAAEENSANQTLSDDITMYMSLSRIISLYFWVDGMQLS